MRAGIPSPQENCPSGHKATEYFGKNTNTSPMPLNTITAIFMQVEIFLVSRLPRAPVIHFFYHMVILDLMIH